MIEKIITQLQGMETKLRKLDAHIDRLCALDSRLQDSQVAYLEGEREGISWSYLQLKRLIDQTPEGIAWERGQGEVGQPE